jgi:hypothetical protein
MDFDKVPSKVSEEVPNTGSSSNELVLQEVPSRYLERAMMVVQNLTSLETFQCFSNQPAPMSILMWQAV